MTQYQGVAHNNPSCIFSIDVEDWFHILDVPSTPVISEWGQLPSIVEKNFLYLLDIIGERNIQTTCFFLGWVAERFPHLVREARARVKRGQPSPLALKLE